MTDTIFQQILTIDPYAIKIDAHTFSTTNYDSITSIYGNRGFEENAKRLATHIAKGNHLDHFPGICWIDNGEIRLGDGQARRSIASNLGVSFFYRIIDPPKNELKYIREINMVATPWNTKDHIISRAQEGHHFYIGLKTFIDIYTDLDTTNLYKLVGVSSKRLKAGSVPEKMNITKRSSDLIRALDELVKHWRHERLNRFGKRGQAQGLINALIVEFDGVDYPLKKVSKLKTAITQSVYNFNLEDVVVKRLSKNSII